ncbi:hypothetical protein PGT21_011162 [Puccinia graminis f. sp. tritici]|uniref:Uncharacterized protein n=1 Tax=Puccinia graminis f. sp. tritici TaxID=56615 RepID=A0A5B0LU23_PUCGR|nr:hypothetical protein PGT21_011162 [Puccinia graminis f. sp. tritici]KAA1092150.1 hypothetical protein PGTUg99_008649 [Puccinia graminis f. sp. tritici]
MYLIDWMGLVILSKNDSEAKILKAKYYLEQEEEESNEEEEFAINIQDPTDEI